MQKSLKWASKVQVSNMTHGPLDLNDFQNYKFKNKQENNKTSDTLYYTCGIVHGIAYYHRTYMHIYKILFPSLSVSLSFRVISLVTSPQHRQWQMIWLYAVCSLFVLWTKNGGKKLLNNANTHSHFKQK